MRTLAAAQTSFGCVKVKILGEADESLLRDYLTLRELVWVRKYGWENRSRVGMETDIYDPYSTFIVAVCDDRVLGGCRLIDGRRIDLPIATLPTEEAVEGGFTEVSRFCLRDASELGGDDRRIVFDALVTGILHNVESLGHTFAYATIRQSLFVTLKKSGIAVRQIGQVHKHHGHCFIPSVISIEGVAYDRAA